MIRKVLSSLIILGLIAVGCSINPPSTSVEVGNNSNIAPSQYPTGTINLSPTTTTTPQIIVNPTKPSGSKTPTPTETLTSTEVIFPIKVATQKCITIEANRPSNILSSGALIFADFTLKQNNGIMMIQSSSGDLSSILKEAPTYSYGEISPDGKLMAYYHLKDDGSSIVIISSKGEILKTYNWEEAWGNFSWINNHQLLIKPFDRTSLDFTLLTPTTDQRQDYPIQLPNYYIETDQTYRGWGILPDPELKRIAYIRSTSGSSKQSFVLWNLETEQELWNLSKYTTRFTEPQWSPDGKYIAVVALDQSEDNFDRFELYIIDRNGNAQLWVDIKGYYPDHGFGLLKWSSDNRYIGFITKGNSPFLLIDMKRGQVYDFCISANTAGKSYGDILWSPDNTQVIIPRDKTPSILLDIDQKKAYQINQQFLIRPVGWLAGEP